MAWTNVDLDFRITRQTSTTLELKSFSYVMQLLGVLLVGVSLSGAWNAGFTQLSCRRLSALVECTAQESRLLGLISHRRVSLSSLKGIFVEQQIATDDEGDPYELYRLTLENGNGAEFVLIKPTRERAHVEAIAAQLNQFSQAPVGQTLLIKERNWIPILAPLFFLPVGLMLLFNPFTICSIDRDKGTVRIQRYSLLLGTLNYDTTVPLRDVVGVAVERWQGEHETGYRVDLVLKGQIYQPLLTTFSPYEGRKQNNAEQIRAFLSLPPVLLVTKQSNEASPDAYRPFT